MVVSVSVFDFVFLSFFRLVLGEDLIVRLLRVCLVVVGCGNGGLRGLFLYVVRLLSVPGKFSIIEFMLIGGLLFSFFEIE